MELFNLIKELIGVDAEITSDKQRIRPTNSEVFRLYSDNTKLYQSTSYKPHSSLEDGLRETIEWFSDKENLKHYKSEIYNV